MAVSAFLTCLPTVAWAHIGAGSTSGFDRGFVHPLTGIDHILAMVAVGTLASMARSSLAN